MVDIIWLASKPCMHAEYVCRHHSYKGCSIDTPGNAGVHSSRAHAFGCPYTETYKWIEAFCHTHTQYWYWFPNSFSFVLHRHPPLSLESLHHFTSRMHRHDPLPLKHICFAPKYAPSEVYGEWQSKELQIFSDKMDMTRGERWHYKGT